MKKLLCLSSLMALLCFGGVANAETIGIVDFDKIVDNYTKVKVLSDQISDKYAEIKRYTLDKKR